MPEVQAAALGLSGLCDHPEEQETRNRAVRVESLPGFAVDVGLDRER